MAGDPAEFCRLAVPCPESSLPLELPVTVAQVTVFRDRTGPAAIRPFGTTTFRRKTPESDGRAPPSRWRPDCHAFKRAGSCCPGRSVRDTVL